MDRGGLRTLRSLRLSGGPSSECEFCPDNVKITTFEYFRYKKITFYSIFFSVIHISKTVIACHNVEQQIVSVKCQQHI